MEGGFLHSWFWPGGDSPRGSAQAARCLFRAGDAAGGAAAAGGLAGSGLGAPAPGDGPPADPAAEGARTERPASVAAHPG